MNLQYKQHIINLFNSGVLSLESAQWYKSQGYSIICSGGQVIEIFKD